MSDGKLQFNCEKGGGNPVIITSQNVNDNNWHFVTATRDNTTGEVILYLDGVFASSGISGVGVINNNSPLTFGRYASTQTNYFTGNVDDISIFNSTLNQQEIQQLMNCPGQVFNLKNITKKAHSR